MAVFTPSQVVIDVNEQTFQREVIERSREVPVVVDFWAPWCGPCRMLGPVLEALAREFNGRFILAKLNVDENPRLAMQYGVQGIPAVKAFKHGRVVAEFVGAQPQPMVRRFIERLLPDELDQQVSKGHALLDAGRFAEAERVFREVVDRNADHWAALLGLARAQLGQGQMDAALETLKRIPEGAPEGKEAARLEAEITLRREIGDADEASLQARLAEAPDDLEARFKLAGLLTLQGRYEDALPHYLEILRRDRSFRDGAAREAMLYIFDQLGDTPIVREYRNKMASVLFA